MKKTIIFCLLAILVFAASAFPATALTVSVQPTDRFFVNDFADVIDAGTENAIYAAGVQLYEKTGAQVVTVTLDTIDGADVQEYGVQLGRDWGVGDKEKDTGIVLLLAMEEREVGISVGYGLEGAVTDAQSGLILDTYALPYFEDGNYAEGLAAVYNVLINEVYLEFGMEADPNYTPVEDLENDSASSSVSLIVLLVFICIISLTMRRARRVHPGFFFITPGGFHHHGGGFGSGGGFGGFRGGGGSFGGGGASRGF